MFTQYDGCAVLRREPGIACFATEYDRISTGIGWPATLVATAVSFAVAFVTVAWLLRFAARHD